MYIPRTTFNPDGPAGPYLPKRYERFFLFLYFSKSFFPEIYFRFHNLQFCTPTARLRGGRPPTALLPGGRDLNVNKICFNRILAPRGEAAARQPGGRYPPPGGGAVGQAAGRQAPPPKLNLERQCGSAALDVVLDILASYRAYLSWYQPKTRYRLLYADMHPEPHVATP